MYWSKELDAILEEILFTHLKEINQLRTITAFNAGQRCAEDPIPKARTYYKVNVGELRANSWSGCY